MQNRWRRVALGLLMLALALAPTTSAFGEGPVLPLKLKPIHLHTALVGHG